MSNIDWLRNGATKVDDESSEGGFMRGGFGADEFP